MDQCQKLLTRLNGDLLVYETIKRNAKDCVCNLYSCGA